MVSVHAKAPLDKKKKSKSYSRPNILSHVLETWSGKYSQGKVVETCRP